MYKYSTLHMHTSFGLEDNAIHSLSSHLSTNKKDLTKNQISPIANTLEFTYNIYAHVYT